MRTAGAFAGRCPKEGAMFPDIGAPIADAVNRFVDWLVVEHGAFFESIANAILVVLVAIEQVLRHAPPLDRFSSPSASSPMRRAGTSSSASSWWR